MAFHLSRLFSGLRVSPVLPSLVSTCGSQVSRSPPLKQLTCLTKRTSSCQATSQLTRQLSGMSLFSPEKNRLLLKPSSVVAINSHRTKTVCSVRKGKPKTVTPVVKRFYRLDWGIWIRPKAGRHRKLWRKGKMRKFRLRQHVFCNRTQSKLLDKMVTSFWRKKKYYVDDPYEPYQQRTNFPLIPEKPKPFYP